MQLTKDCIDSIIKYTSNVEYEIILVDNNSNDGSKDLFQLDNRITYIYNENNLGFGIANNIGSKIAKGRYLFFLNSDTLLFDNSIFELYNFLENNSNVVVCGGNLVSKDMLPTSSFERFFPSIVYELNEIFLKIPGKIIFGRNSSYNYTNNSIKVAYVSGADLMIRTNVFAKLGGFDEEFFMYFEETDLCKRASCYGDIVSIPNAQIIHFGGQSSKDSPKYPSDNKLKIQNKSSIYFIRKHHSSIYVKIYHIIKVFSAYLRVLEFTIIHDEGRTDLWKRVVKLYK